MMKIKIDISENCVLKYNEAKYIFETICIAIGSPWEFITENESELDIYYGTENNTTAFVNIKAETSPFKSPHVISQNGLEFFTSEAEGQDHLHYSKKGDRHFFINDIIYTCFYLLTGKDEVGIDRDKWDRHVVEQSILHKNDLLHKPIVDAYSQFIKKLFANKIDLIPLWPNGKKAALALSHDVDYPEMIKSIELLRYAGTKKNKTRVKTIKNIISGKETFWKFNDWMELEAKYKAKSAFYLSSYKGNLPRFLLKAPDPFYDIKKKKYIKLIDDLKNKGWEVGLHSSYLAGDSEENFNKEHKQIKKTFQLDEVGHRHHYWHTNPEDPSETCAIHQKIGLAYDSSLVFGWHSGFRFGICTPYHVWNRKKEEALTIYQLPPTLMDDHLFGYAKHTKFQNWQSHIDSLIKAIIENNGIFVADFHVRVLNNTFFPEWGDAYKYLIKTVHTSGDFYIDTPLNISKYCHKREQSIRNKSIG